MTDIERVRKFIRTVERLTPEQRNALLRLLEVLDVL